MNHDTLANLRRTTPSAAHVGDVSAYPDPFALLLPVGALAAIATYRKGHTTTGLVIGGGTALFGAWLISQ